MVSDYRHKWLTTKGTCNLERMLSIVTWLLISGVFLTSEGSIPTNIPHPSPPRSQERHSSSHILAGNVPTIHKTVLLDFTANSEKPSTRLAHHPPKRAMTQSDMLSENVGNSNILEPKTVSLFRIPNSLEESLLFPVGRTSKSTPFHLNDKKETYSSRYKLQGKQDVQMIEHLFPFPPRCSPKRSDKAIFTHQKRGGPRKGFPVHKNELATGSRSKVSAFSYPATAEQNVRTPRDVAEAKTYVRGGLKYMAKTAIDTSFNDEKMIWSGSWGTHPFDGADEIFSDDEAERLGSIPSRRVAADILDHRAKQAANDDKGGEIPYGPTLIVGGSKLNGDEDDDRVVTSSTGKTPSGENIIDVSDDAKSNRSTGYIPIENVVGPPRETMFPSLNHFPKYSTDEAQIPNTEAPWEAQIVHRAFLTGVDEKLIVGSDGEAVKRSFLKDDTLSDDEALSDRNKWHEDAEHKSILRASRIPAVLSSSLKGHDTSDEQPMPSEAQMSKNDTFQFTRKNSVRGKLNDESFFVATTAVYASTGDVTEELTGTYSKLAKVQKFDFVADLPALNGRDRRIQNAGAQSYMDIFNPGSNAKINIETSRTKNYSLSLSNPVNGNFTPPMLINASLGSIKSYLTHFKDLNKNFLDNSAKKTTPTDSIWHFQKDSELLEATDYSFPSPTPSVRIAQSHLGNKKNHSRDFVEISQTEKQQFAKGDNKANSTKEKNHALQTTPDPHMNDPPFIRGPNISPDKDLVIKKNKEDPEKEYNGESTLVEPPKLRSTRSELNWAIAKREWGIAWHLHCYATGILFLVLMAYSLISLLRVKTFIRLFSIGYFVTLNIIVLFACATRAFYLFYDPYNTFQSYSAPVSQLLFDITFPCLSSAFSVLFLALLQATKIEFLPPKFQRPACLSAAVIFHFSFAMTCDALSGVFLGSKYALLLSCQVVFIFWCTLTTVGYISVFRKIHRSALRKQGEMIRITFTKMHIDGAQLPKNLPKPTLGLTVKVTLGAAIFQLLFALLFPYGATPVELLLPKGQRLSPWLWWGYHLTCRILELIIFAAISFVATQPLKHYELGNSRFFNVLMWFPCSSFAECCKREEVMDFEVHSDNYANLQGFRNCGLTVSNSTRRLQTNSLPTFRTPLTDIDNTLPMRNLPLPGRNRNTNHPSALSLLSYYRSKRNLSLSTNGGLSDLERTIGHQGTFFSESEVCDNSLRPASMLYKDNGFIRFRTDNDPHQPMELSDDEDRAVHDDQDTSVEDTDSTRANAGSSIHSLLEEDIVQSSLSPFFRLGYNPRFRKMSRISVETTDNSADVSSEHLSSVLRLSGSALDFNSRKHGSTCSSESAANSFDVTFYLHGVNPTPIVSHPITPSSSRAYRSETEEDKTSSVEGHEVLLRSVSPIVRRSATRRLHELPLNLNLTRTGDLNLQGGHVNVACGTEDITPDSAVYLDLQLSREPTMLNAEHIADSFPSVAILPPPIFSFSDSLTPSSDVTSSSGTPVAVSGKIANVTSTSQSLSDLRRSNSYVVVTKPRRTSRGLFNKLRGSTFSLNAAINGYEPLEPEDGSYCYTNGSYSRGKRKLRRVASDRRPGSEGHGEDNPTPLSEFRDRCVAASVAHLGDSGLLGDCQDYDIAHIDTASQTDPFDRIGPDASSVNSNTFSSVMDHSSMSAMPADVDLGK